jgi:hypothetical protein
LFSYLKEKQALLLTDNLEHLLAEPGIELLAELLQRSASQIAGHIESRDCKMNGYLKLGITCSEHRCGGSA